MVDLAAMLLADGRFPAGGHAHSGGVEAAVHAGRIIDEASLEDFVRGRLMTTGLVDAALVVATARRVAAAESIDIAREELLRLDAEANPRMVAQPLHDASRRLGRQLARTAARCWPDSVLALIVESFPGGAHQSVVLGTVSVVVDMQPADAARLSVYHTISTPAHAGIRLMGLDPFGVTALIARLADDVESVVAQAVACSPDDLAALPARAAPLIDISSTDHAQWDVRLFAT